MKRSAFEDVAAGELAVELDQTAEAEKGFDLVVSVECAEHAGEVVGLGDLGTEAPPERLAVRAAAEVVVAASPCRFGHELELAGGRLELDHGSSSLRRSSGRVQVVRETGATGLEPATSGVTGRRSNRLNYAPLRESV